jgi:hypothetical protein
MFCIGYNMEEGGLHVSPFMEHWGLGDGGGRTDYCGRWAWQTHKGLTRRRINFDLNTTIQLINSMELSLSCEAASCAATQEFSNILWNLKVHYRVHNSPSPMPVLRQINQVHTTPSYFSNISLNIVLPPMSRCS